MNIYKKVKTPLCDKVIVLHFITTRVSTLWVSSGNDKYHANIEVYTDVKQLSAQFILILYLHKPCQSNTSHSYK